MAKVDQCVILAAGNGSRLAVCSGSNPKPLVALHGAPLLEHVILAARQAGIRKFVIVIGYRGEVIRQWLAQRNFSGITVELVENRDYHKANGVSLLKAREIVRGPFLLLMSDHVFESRTARSLLNQPLAAGEVILAVDPKLDRVFDMDDATKVRREGNRIVAIGKELSNYDACDTGMFVCSPELFDALEKAKRDGNCSLSDGMRRLGEAGRFRAFEIGDALWQDVDTPEALAHAERLFAPIDEESLVGV
jgi:choline kinase